MIGDDSRIGPVLRAQAAKRRVTALYCQERLIVPGTDDNFVPCPERAESDLDYCRFHKPAYRSETP